jgi:type VI protein secretion system component VasK
MALKSPDCWLGQPAWSWLLLLALVVVCWACRSGWLALRIQPGAKPVEDHAEMANRHPPGLNRNLQSIRAACPRTQRLPGMCEACSPAAARAPGNPVAAVLERKA